MTYILESLSRKLQNRVAEILKIISFNEENSDAILLSAIEYYKNKNGEITATAPQDFLNNDEKEAVVSENGLFRTSLYKILLFMHVADAIKSGKLNLKQSYRYLAIQDYLVDKVTWKSRRNELLKLAGLEEFSDYNIVIKKFIEL